MKTELDNKNNIAETTIKIEDKCNYLTGITDEIPATNTQKNTEEINGLAVDNYQESLNNLLKKYTNNHHTKTKK